MIYQVQTPYETLHSIVYNYYKAIDMINTVLLLNSNLESVYLQMGDKVYLPQLQYNVKNREKLY